MGTWDRSTFVLAPRSYRKLLLRWSILLEGKPDASRATAARYILRRLSFQADQKAAYTCGVQRALESGEGVSILEATVDELGAGELEPWRPDVGVRVPVTIRLDPWSVENLRLRRAVLQARHGKKIGRSEALRRVLRRRRFTDEQRRLYEAKALDRIRREEPEAFEVLVEDGAVPA